MRVQALDEIPVLDPDLQKLLDTFLIISRSRPPSMSKIPANTRITDIIAMWQPSGWQRIGMPLKDFIESMQQIDAEYIQYFTEIAEQEK